MSRRVKRRERKYPAAGLIHLLNQRYRREWERAEILQGELDRLARSPLGPLIAALRWVKRRFIPLAAVPPLAEKSTAYVPTPGITSPKEQVSIILPFRDQCDLLRNCVRSLVKGTRRRFELILVNNGSTEPRTLRFLDCIAKRRFVSVVDVPDVFNFSRLCNAGATQASGEYLLFLNNDTEVLQSDWLLRMMEIAVDPTVGVVGATLLYPDHTIQHAGLFPRVDGTWVHPYRGEPRNTSGADGELRTPRCVPAVTAACLMMRRTLFIELGGFDEHYPTTFNDVDLCRRVRQCGYSIVITPHARLLHYEGLSRGYTP